MRSKGKALAVSIAVTAGAVLSVGATNAQPVDTARIAAGDPNDWLAYHQSYNGWSYSPLDQINANNVKDLEVAWIHVPGHSTRGLQSMPARHSNDSATAYAAEPASTARKDSTTGASRA